MPFFWWSRTSATNANADPTINQAEGMAPSQVNDSARAMMSALRQWGDDISGAIVTTGTSTAYAVTSYSVYDTLAHMAGQMIAFVPHATNTNAVGVDITLNVDGLGAKSVRAQPSVALPNGSLVLGTPYVVTYNNTDAVFYLRNMTNPYLIPLGTSLEYWGSTAPNSSFVFPFGQAISRTTYATLWTLFSNQYGNGDGSTTFNIPDLRGRVVAGVDNMGGSAANRITNAGSGIVGTTLGANGGAETQTLTAAQMPSHTHTGTTATMNSNTAHSHTQTIPGGSAVGGGGAFGFDTAQASTVATSTVNIDHTHGFTTGSAGSGSAHVNVQPTIICNRILRII